MESMGDLDTPEELTLEEGIKQDEQIRKIKRENRKRVAHEGKERRREWALKRNKSKSDEKIMSKAPDSESREDAHVIRGLLPSNLVNLLAAHDRHTFTSDSEEEAINHEPVKMRKKRTFPGPETVLLKELLPAHCSENSAEFLKSRKMKVPRSNFVLKNSKQALRFLSAPGNILRKG